MLDTQRLIRKGAFWVGLPGDAKKIVGRHKTAAAVGRASDDDVVVERPGTRPGRGQ